MLLQFTVRFALLFAVTLAVLGTVGIKSNADAAGAPQVQTAQR